MELLVNKTGVEADTGMLEAQSLPQLEQVEFNAEEAEGDGDTEAPGETSVDKEPRTGGTDSGNSEERYQSVSQGRSEGDNLDLLRVQARSMLRTVIQANMAMVRKYPR